MASANAKKDGMKQNKDTTKVNPLGLCQFFHYSDRDIQAIVDKASVATDLLVQQECIKSLAAYLDPSAKPEDREFVLKLLSFVFLSTTPSVPIKKTVTRTLTAIKDSNDLLTKKMSEVILQMILEVISQEKNSDDAVMFRDSLVTGLCTSLDFKPAFTAVLNDVNVVFKFTLGFLLELVDYLWKRKSGTGVITTHKHKYIYNTTKFLLSILQKCDVKVIKMEDRFKLITCCYDVMTHTYTTYDVKSNCAHIMVILFRALPEDIVNECTFKEYPYFEFLKFGKEHSLALEKIGIKNIKDAAVFEPFKVVIYLGIVIVSPRDALHSCTFKDKTIFCILFRELIESAQRAKGEPSQVMGITKAISYLSSHLSGLADENANSLLKEGLNYVIMYIDDRTEVVRNNNNTIFRNLIRLAVKHRDKGNPELLRLISNWLNNLQEGALYRALTVFCSEVGCAALLENIPNVAQELLSHLVHPSKARSICLCYGTLMQLHADEGGSEGDWVKFWVAVIIAELKKSQPPLTHFLQELFVTAFKIRTVALKVITQVHDEYTDAEFGAFLSCIHHARKTGINLQAEDVYGCQIDKRRCWNELVQYSTMEDLMTHQNNEIRILVLAMIVDTNKSTEAFTDWELQFLPNYFSYNINTPNASMRQQIVAYAKKTMQRIVQSFIVVYKNADSFRSKIVQNVPASEVKSMSEYATKLYSEFWKKLLGEVLLVGLNPDCNYSRKSACLELLNFACTVIDKEDFFQFWGNDDFCNLKYILQYDTYEQNKDLAARLLMICPAQWMGFENKEVVTQHLDECFKLALSIKPAQTVSAAYMLKACLDSPHICGVLTQRLSKSVSLNSFKKTVGEACLKDTVGLILFQLILELKACVVATESGLQEAAATKPLHGFLFCIRHILKDEDLSKRIGVRHWKIFIKDMLFWCYRVSKIVSPIICNASPEGYLPDDAYAEVSEADETAKAQMVTVYGWRAAKEISLLLGEFALKAPYDDGHTQGLISEKQLGAMGNYLFYLLLNTKHRGAFEQASLGFTNLCSKLWQLPTSTAMPTEWLRKILNSLLGIGGETVDVCSTRRSAGVPFLVQAILTTEPSTTGNKHFQSCMNILLAVAGDSKRPEEQRIHCMNVLRALYRNNQLGEHVIGYCARGVIISVEGFGNSSWGIRNSATLLFSALMVRIFGVQRVRDAEIVSIKNKMLVQVFFVRYPELYNFLLQKLGEAAKNVHHPSLFPVLLILSRLYCAGSTDVFQIQPFLPYIETCFANPVHRIREVAAKIYVHLASEKQASKLIVISFVSLTDVILSNNHCHGMLLQLQYLLQSQKKRLPPLNIEKIFDNTAWILVCCGRQISHATATLYIEILIYLITECDPLFSNCAAFEKMLSVIQWQTKPDNNKMVSTAAKKYKVYMFNLKLCAILNLFRCSGSKNTSIERKVTKQYIYDDLKTCKELQTMCLSYINYIKFIGPKYESHNLFEDNDCEYSELINKFVQPLKPVFKRYLYDILHSVLQRILVTKKVEDTTNLEILILHDLPEHLKHYDTGVIKQWLLDYNIKCCKSGDEATARICLAWLDNFIQELRYLELIQLDFDRLIDMLLKFSAPAAETSHRLGVAKLLNHNKRLFYHKDFALKWSNMCMLWEAVFILLEDDDEDVRNNIAQLCHQSLTKADCRLAPRTKSCTPEFARKLLLIFMAEVIPVHCSINMLLSLTLRTKEVTNGNLSEVFEEGTSNAYAELYPVAHVTTEQLTKLLWKLSGVSVDTESILIEEQALLIATLLYNKFYRNVVPLISAAMSTAARNILSRLILFLKNETVNQEDFKCHFKDVINQALLTQVGLLDTSEVIRLKMLISKIFMFAL